MKYLCLQRSAAVLRISDQGGSTPLLEDQMEPFIAATPHLVLDVSGILFTSMLIGELVNLVMQHEAHWQGRESATVSLINVIPQTRRVLEVVKLTRHIGIFDSLEDALDVTTTQPLTSAATSA